jgi:hypothetical protein
MSNFNIDDIKCPAGSRSVQFCGALAFIKVMNPDVHVISSAIPAGPREVDQSIIINTIGALYSYHRGFNGPSVSYGSRQENYYITIINYHNGLKSGIAREYLFNKFFGQLYGITKQTVEALLKLEPGRYDYSNVAQDGREGLFVATTDNPAVEYRIAGYYLEGQPVTEAQYRAKLRSEIREPTQEPEDLLKIIASYL